MTRRVRRSDPARKLPPVTDWRTTDADETLKRHVRAREERPRVVNLDPAYPIFSDFEVNSPTGLAYRVEIRDVANRQFACTCTDFRINGLGTCKHVEAVLLHVTPRQRAEFKAAKRGAPSPRIDLVPDQSAGRLRIERNLDRLPSRLRASRGDRPPTPRTRESLGSTAPATLHLLANRHLLRASGSRR